MSEVIDLEIGNRWQVRNAQKIAKNTGKLIAVHSLGGVHIGYVTNGGSFTSNKAYNNMSKYLASFIGTNPDFYTIEKRKLLLDNITDFKNK